MKKILAVIITTFAVALSYQTVVLAQTPRPAQTPAQPGSGQALEIGPPVLTLSGDPGATVKSRISLRDVSPNKLIVTNEINDFVAGGEDGIPKLIFEKDEPSPYSIKSWIAPLPRFNLVPRQVQSVDITINIPKNAAPGGYYGVIRFTGTPPGLEGNGVSLSASIGTLILLRVNGDAKEEVSVEEFYAASNGKKTTLFQSAPIELVQRLKNSGNIHEQPTGVITIKDMFGNLLATTEVNQPPRNILPGSIRKFNQVIDSSKIGNKFLFGKYTAKMDLVYGGEAKPLTATVEFWVIPYMLIGAIILGLIALFILIRIALKTYAKRLLNQNTRGRRR